MEKDEAYISAVAGLGGKVEDLIRQNNAIDIYEDYFSGAGANHESETPYAKTLTVFRDPSEIKRSASYISWKPGLEDTGESPKCAIAYSILGFQQQPEGMSKSSYIWDVNTPNRPHFELRPPSQLCCVKYNEKGECVQRFEHFAVQVGKVELTTILVSGPRRPLIIPFVADAPSARSYRVRKCSWERCSA